MKIYVAADHAGYELKTALVEYLRAKGYEVGDLGAYKLDPTDDYPDFIHPCAVRVAQARSGALGIVIGGTGQGEAIVANKVKGIRAAVYNGEDMEIVRLARLHNNANVLSLGARFLTDDEAKRAVDVWLGTQYEAGRHIRRLAKIEKIENGTR